MAKPVIRPQRQKYSKVRQVQQLRFGNAAGPHGLDRYSRNIKHRPIDPEDWERFEDSL